MSADNGIYILKTKDQYRVIHAQAIENLYWTPLNNNHQKLIPTRIVEYFGKSKYTRDINLARNIAFSMAKECPVLEYGINEIYINKTWKQIVEEAKKLALQEIEVLKNKSHIDGRWNWKIKRLEEIIKM